MHLDPPASRWLLASTNLLINAKDRNEYKWETVSYTHLTLPTKRIV